jgi:tripartite-type tricarboxylate transporter receptor subunit TctC
MRIASLLGAVLLLAAGSACAQYPVKPIRVIIDTSPGGVTDIMGRMAAEGLAQKVGQSVVVENRAGASGVVAIEHVAKSPPDGYTLVFAAGGNITVQPFRKQSLPYDPVTDIIPVCIVGEVAHILVVPGSLPVKSLADFVAYAKAHPGKVSYGSAGVGSPPHLSIALLARVAGLDMVHVPYKGLGTAMPDFISGRLQALSIALGTAGGHIKTGAMRALATGADRRLTQLPDVPTSAEAGFPGWKMSAWFGMFAPKGTPDPILRLLNERLQQVIEEPKAKQRLFDAGAEPAGGSLGAIAERYRGDFKLWGTVIRESGIKLE